MFTQPASSADADIVTSSAVAMMDRLTPADISDDPFPHFVVKNALPPELAEQLLAAFPDEAAFDADPAYDGKRHRIYGLANERLDASAEAGEVIKAFCRTLREPAFADRMVSLFAGHIRRAYPKLDLSDIRRNMKASGKINISAALADDASINPLTLFTMLIYLRRKDDRTQGGDLQLYAPHDPGFQFDEKGRELPTEVATVIKTIPYEHNTAVAFMNGPLAFHGVSLRQATSYPRTTISFALHLPEPVFEIRRRGFGQRLRRLRRRVTRLLPAGA